MRKYIFFLKCSSIVIKVTAWVFLLLGIVGGVSLLSGSVPGNPRWMGAMILVFYMFVFFFLFLVAKLADILGKLINETYKV